MYDNLAKGFLCGILFAGIFIIVAKGYIQFRVEEMLKGKRK